MSRAVKLIVIMFVVIVALGIASKAMFTLNPSSQISVESTVKNQK